MNDEDVGVGVLRGRSVDEGKRDRRKPKVDETEIYPVTPSPTSLRRVRRVRRRGDGQEV